MNTGLAFMLVLACIAKAQPSASKQDWELVRSVANEFGGTSDFVLIPEVKQRDRDYYIQVANAVCGVRTTCKVNFWTDRKHIPQAAPGGWIPVEAWAVMTGEYERHPRYKKPVLNLACWLYPNKAVGESDKCAYFPGTKRPQEK